MWKIAIALIVLMMAFFMIGLYVGGGVYLLLIGGSFGQATLTTLMDLGEFSLTHRQKMFLPWAWCVTVAFTFLPMGLTFFALLTGKKKQISMVTPDSPTKKNSMPLNIKEIISDEKPKISL